MLSLAVALIAQSGELLRNGDFEKLSGEMPAEWTAIAPAEHQKACEFASDGRHARSGRSARISNTNPRNRGVTAFSQKLDAESARESRGKTLELSAWVRTYEATVADVWMQCYDEAEKELALIRPRAYGSVWGTTEWAKVVARGVVPEKTRAIVVRCVVRGIGEAWFDDLSARETKAVPHEVPPVRRDDLECFREAAAKYVAGTDRDAIRPFAAWTPEQVDAALARGLGPAPWASGHRRMKGCEVWIPAEAKEGPRPLLLVLSREKDAHRPWADVARDLFVVRAEGIEALRDVCARFPIEADRVYTTSPSFAMAHPDRMAGVAALGEPLDGVAKAARRLAGQAWWIADAKVDRDVVEEFRTAAVVHTAREHLEASRDDLAIDRGNALDWLTARKRTPPRAAVDGGAATVEGNTVTIDGVRGAVRVWLRVDFERPVKIVAGGKTLFEGAVKPSFDAFLERLAATADTGATYWALVEVRVE